MVASSTGDGISPPPGGQWVVVICEERRFGFPLESVSEILTPRVLTRLPGTGPEVCGLAGVHGKVITVLDLGVLLGLRAAGPYTDHRLLLLDLDARQIGVVVEDVAAIAAARVERSDVVQSDAAIIGTGRTEEGEFTALEPSRLLGHLLLQ